MKLTTGVFLVGSALALIAAPLFAQATADASPGGRGQAVSIQSGGKAYASCLAAAPGPGRKPGIVLLHSFNGLEIRDLQRPLLMIHGSADQASPIAGIFQYAAALQQAGKYFELKVYQDLPHGFMVQNGRLWDTDTARDAYGQMVGFFRRMMG